MIQLNQDIDPSQINPKNQHKQHPNQQLQSQQTPRTYFDLILKVGSHGKYQKTIFIIFFCNWFLTYMLILQTIFLFMNTQIDCQNLKLDQQSCQKFVCSLPDNQQIQYLKSIQIKSLTIQFGPFICGKQYIISTAKTALFSGILIGYIIFLFFSDNFGRKFSIILTWTVCTIGLIILVTAQSMEIACLGLFLAGSGCQSAIRINMTVFSQICDYHKRQIYSVALQISLGIAGILISILYLLISNWKIINLFFICFPSILLLFILIWYLQETPKFLLRKSKYQALKSLNRIGLINKGVQNILREEDIQRVIIYQKTDDQKNNLKITIIDLCRYKSLRKKTFCMCIIFFSIAYIYYEAAFLVDQIGYNIYLTQSIISFSEMIAYILVLPFITIIRRRFTGIVCFSIALIFLIVLMFIPRNQNCQSSCIQKLIETICAFLVRFLISFYHCILFVYVNQIFPTRTRGIGFGLCSAAGALSATFGNIILTFLKLHNLSPHLMNIPLVLIAILVLFNLPQTFNQAIEQQIQQLKIKDNDI